jgi:urease accessory protein
MPYDAPVFRMLQAAGFKPVQQVRKLLYPLRTTVAAHSHDNSLFSKILKLTSSNAE